MDRLMTWPNAITVTRLFLGLFGIWIAQDSELLIWGLVVFAVGGLVPDFFDGWLARKLNQVSRVGEFIDPFADKVLFYFPIVVLFEKLVFWPLLAVLFLCDVVSTMIHFRKKGGAVITGKWKFGMQCSALGFFAGSILIYEQLVILAHLSIVVAVICACHSLYYRVRA